MIELQPEQFKGPAFQYGPRTKAKPNSQGTLFRVNKSQRKPESRQPKGYSRERLADVAINTNLAGVYDRGLEFSGGTGSNWRNAQEAHQTAQTIARSTIPLEHLNNLRILADSPVIGKGTDSPNTAGRYTPGRSEVLGYYDKPAHIDIAPGHSQSSTPIHEVGHHVEQNFSGSPAQRGTGEGLADNYADIHARLPGYKRKPAYARGFGDASRPSDWHEGYGMDTPKKRREFNSGYFGARQGSYEEMMKPRGGSLAQPGLPGLAYEFHMNEPEFTGKIKARIDDEGRQFLGG